MFKRFRIAAAALLAAGSLWACSDDEPTPDSIPDKPATENHISVESVSPDIVAAEGGEVTVTVKSGRVPTGKADADWVTRVSSSREGEIATFVFAVKANEGSEERSSVITFKAGDLTADATIRQAAGETKPAPIPDLTDVDSSVDFARVLGLG